MIKEDWGDEGAQKKGSSVWGRRGGGGGALMPKLSYDKWVGIRQKRREEGILQAGECIGKGTDMGPGNYEF